MKLTGTVAGAGALAGQSGGTRIRESVQDHGEGHSDDQSEDHGDDAMRIDMAQRVSPRDFESHNYERIYSHRKLEAVRTLLMDPAVNEVAQKWVASFDAYEPLTKNLELVSLQGTRGLSVEGNLDDGFSITAESRQVAYGLVDRVKNELVALQLTEPMDVSWEKTFDEEGIRRGKLVLEQPEVQEFIGDDDWYAMFKVAEIITAYKDFAHGEASPVAFYVVREDSLEVVSAFIDVTDPENPSFLDVTFVEDFVEFPPEKLAKQICPHSESVLGKVPKVPFEKRPYYTANNGYHRIEEPPESFENSGWSVEWTPPVTQGVTMKAAFNGKPVFEAIDSPVTFTGYALPPREGRPIKDWYFPNDDPVFVGHLLFWDIHSVDFGGPGPLGVIDYPERNGHPEGFRFKTHYHTGAHERESVDFHSGHRFGPYNYDISFEFFADGSVRPIWRRHGPGYVVEHMMHDHHDDHGGGEPVVQHYTAATAMDVTPGTTDGVEVQLFDGDEWRTPESEFYVTGEPGMKARFSNPNGPETIDIPLDRDTELVVVRRSSEEIGPGEHAATRVVDEEAEHAFYHPAQYVDGDPIQGERVVVWLLLEAATGQMPHPSGLTAFAAVGDVQLKGYPGIDEDEPLC